jgi:hypothetical protein
MGQVKIFVWKYIDGPSMSQMNIFVWKIYRWVINGSNEYLSMRNI